MPRISAVINTRNEESNIRYCLETLKWCDEIIVVDMESEDRTVEIAREYTDKVFSHEIVLAFDIARKYAVEKATGEWILMIDADEMVPKALSNLLVEIVATDKTDVVFIPFKTYIMGEWIQHTMWWPEYHPRFFKRGAFTFVETIHDYMQISESARKIYLEVTEKNAIYHFNYRDSCHFVEKLNKYTDIEAKHLIERGEKFKVRRLTWPLKEFWKRYVKHKGYKDGYRGFFLSIMMAFYRFLTLVKLWEADERKKPDFDYQPQRKMVLDSYDE